MKVQSSILSISLNQRARFRSAQVVVSYTLDTLNSLTTSRCIIYRGPNLPPKHHQTIPSGTDYSHRAQAGEPDH